MLHYKAVTLHAPLQSSNTTCSITKQKHYMLHYKPVTLHAPLQSSNTTCSITKQQHYMLHYKAVTLHAPLQSSNNTCFIVHLCYFFVVGVTMTNTINGFPLQMSLLQLWTLRYTIS